MLRGDTEDAFRERLPLPAIPARFDCMDEKKQLHNFVGVTTDVSVLLRELCVVALFGLLFFWPDTFKSRLTRLGISKLATPVGEIDINGAGGTVATLNRGLSDTIMRLQQIQTASKDPHISSELQKITTYLQSMQQEAATTDESIKTTLATQQTTQEQTSPQSANLPGWILAGHVGADKLHWFGDSGQNVSNTLSPNFTVGEKFNVISHVYLRADAPSGAHFGGKAIGIVPANGQVQVISGPDYSNAIAGGYFLWVKVQPLQ